MLSKTLYPKFFEDAPKDDDKNAVNVNIYASLPDEEKQRIKDEYEMAFNGADLVQ